jgi:hypothetical protein
MQPKAQAAQQFLPPAFPLHPSPSPRKTPSGPPSPAACRSLLTLCSSCRSWRCCCLACDMQQHRAQPSDAAPAAPLPLPVCC